MGQNLDKFLLLMWKNWVLQYRRPIQTLVEILAPVIFSIILVLIRSLVVPKQHDALAYNPFCTLPLNVPDVCGLDFPTSSSSALRKALSKKLGGPYSTNTTDPMDYFQNFTLIYSPENDATHEVMRPFGFIFGNVTGLDNSTAIDNYYALSTSKTTFAAVQFDDSLAGRTDLGPTKNVKVSIRFPGELRYSSGESNWLTNLMFPMYQTAGPRSPEEQTGAAPSYFKEQFLAIQHILAVLISWNNGGVNTSSLTDKEQLPAFLSVNQLPLINMQRFPYPSYQEDLLLTPLKGFVSIIILLSFVYTCINTVKAITQEKEKQLKEAMKIMGLPNWLHWTAWFLKTFSFLMVSIILMVVLLKVKWYTNMNFTVFTHANAFVLLIFLFFYVCATITFCFAVSVFFSKANTASTVAGLIWFLSYAPYSFIQQNYDTLSLSTKLLTSLGSNTAMAYGFQIIIMYEGSGEGVQFNNLFTPNTVDDDLSLGVVMIMLIFDCLLYLLIALYVEAIFPGEYGVPQKWYFPFTKTFWCGQPKYTGVEDFSNTKANEGEFHEAEPTNLHAGIKIKNLRKSFAHKAAVRNLSLNMYEDQITVLLGHNGAGKTTTMSMLTGMFPPSGGTAIVSGYDIRTNMDSIRNSLGLCPQHNIIFDDLTVAEHLYFFSRLKGLRRKEIDAEITKYVDLLELQPKRDAKSSTLSGGMKRKLCVGMALCGNSKVVMLDEPTAGMDPSARRALWDLMLRMKTGRTVLLTTHFMDEADLLGDRIAIMAGGELQCCGSSFFLKKKYGAGYHLIMDKSNKCISEKVTALLRKHIPNIDIHGDVGSELSYLLAESQSYIFETMLRDLEQHSEELGVNSYGISLTTLEEVFMKVGADHGQEEMYNGKLDKEINGNKPPPQTPVNFAAGTLTGPKMLLNQLIAMTMKKILSTLRSWILLVIQILMPVIFLIIVMIVSKTSNQGKSLPAMPLSLSKYSNAVVLVDGVNDYNDYASRYHEVVGGAYKAVSNVGEEILKLTAEMPSTVRRSYIGGASFKSLPIAARLFFDVNFVTYFNNDPYHTPGVALGLALNTMYRKIVKCSDCSIEFNNHPFTYTPATQITQLSNSNNMGFQLAFNIAFSMAFVSSFYIIFIVRERITKSKHLQFVSGVKVFIFWLVTWFWDFVTFLITIVVLLITLICFQEEGFDTAADIGRMFLIFLSFGWSMLPMIYFAGFMFDIPSTGYTRMTMFSIFTGVAAFLIVQVLASPGLDLEYVGDALHWVFLVVPHYSMSTGILDAYKTFFYNNMCDKFYDLCWSNCPNCTTKSDCLTETPSMSSYCEGLDDNYLKWEEPGIGRNLFYSFFIGTILLIALLIVEYKVFSKIIYNVRQKYFSMGPVDVPDEDTDVQAERHKIRNIPEAELIHNNTMVLKDLTKYYKKFLAVNGLSLGIKKYECFGLLGINGAGKTTTFKMLTGDVKISHGDAWVDGKSIKHEIKEVQKLIGYCPQFDALLDDLTARETLTMFALLRGIPYNYCNRIAERLAGDFDYQRHLDKKVKELSGGNKRKLSTSIALIGDPPVMYLDEPTTGMDPGTKRYLWNALCQVRDSGKTIVLTSHSMEECEALCTRLAIMVNGNFKCLGSTQHLKNKFAAGYTITIKVKKPENSSADQHSATDQLERFMHENFPGSVLREKHEELLTYYVTDTTMPWSKMFGMLEEAKRRDLNIEDYSLGQSSLEQVFLTFTKHQVETE